MFGISSVMGETSRATASATRSSASTRRVPVSMRRRPERQDVSVQVLELLGQLGVAEVSFGT